MRREARQIVERTLGVTAFVLATWVVPAVAQTRTEFDPLGFQPNHDYIELQPFEHVDTLGANLIISLPMLTLQGNAGHALTFELTYNTNVASGSEVPWSFGIAGVPMRIIEGFRIAPGGTVAGARAQHAGLMPAAVNRHW